MITKPQYIYKARVDPLKPLWDGDTIYLQVDLGFDTWKHCKLRVLGVDTPEISRCSEEEKQYGLEAREFVRRILVHSKEFVIRSVKDTKYDYGAEVLICVNEVGKQIPVTTLAQHVILAGMGVPYDGGTKLPWEERKKIQDEAREKYSSDLDYSLFRDV